MKRILLVIAIASALVSCNKVLDQPNDGRLTLKQIFSDFTLTKGYVNKCYSYMPGGGIIDDYTMSYGGTLLASYSDEAQDVRDALTGNVQNWYMGRATAASFPMADFWSLYYQGIRTCNTFLKEIKTAPFISEKPTNMIEAKMWRAHVHALRAFYFLQIIKRYGPAPITRDALGENSDYSKMKRASLAACVDSIMLDCKQAKNLGLPWKIGAAGDNDYGRMSLAVVYAIESEAALYAASPLWNDGDGLEKTEKWKWAAGIAGRALNECLNNGYELFSTPPGKDIAASSSCAYQTYFFSKMDIARLSDKETIYESKNRLAIWRDAGLPTSANTIRAGACPTQEMVDAYEMATGEPPFVLDENGCVVYDGLNPRVNPGSGYDPANPYEGRDPRLKASVYYNGALLDFTDPESGLPIHDGGDCSISATDQRHTRTGYYLRKFHHNRSNVSNQADGFMKIFRLGELYLNFAEAANEGYGPGVVVPEVNGSVNTALKAVNAVRERAGMPRFDRQGAPSKTEFRKKYRNERRVELAFEQHRFYDVRRWNILGQTDRRATGMQITAGAGEFTYVRFKVGDRSASDSKYLLFPLPAGEVSKMEMYTGTNWQNPMW